MENIEIKEQKQPSKDVYRKRCAENVQQNLYENTHAKV